MPRIRTIAAIRSEIEKKQKQVDKLQAKRQKLLDQLNDVEDQIRSIGGHSVLSDAAGTAASSGPAGSTGRRKRPRNDKPLADYIDEVLSRHAEGLRIKEIMLEVQDAGYVSNSKNFYSIIAAAMQDEKYERVGRGVYRLRKDEPTELEPSTSGKTASGEKSESERGKPKTKPSVSVGQNG
ncbi:MAG: hypothetical protein ACLFVU_04210 [Phycisphaerae bacterium]